MNSLKSVAAASIASIALILGGPQSARADLAPGVIQLIDVAPILSLDIGNSLGLAYNPDLNVIYLSHGSDNRGSFIYTIDLNGQLISTLDFAAVYQPFAVATTLSYERSSGHLFVFCFVATDETFTAFTSHRVEISPDGSTIFSDLTPLGCGTLIREDGLWESRNEPDAIRHCTRDGVFVEDIPLDGFPGSLLAPSALASSFRGGFFVVDHFGRRLVEVDGAGKAIAEGSTATLPGVAVVGRGMAIDSDPASQRIFIQVENAQIYVLSQEFLRPIVNSLMRLDSLSFACSRNPVPGGPAGTCLFTARFTNKSANVIDTPVLLVIQLDRGNLLLNAEGGPRGIGATVTPDVGADGVLAPGEAFVVELSVGLDVRLPFTFLVDLLAEAVQ